MMSKGVSTMVDSHVKRSRPLNSRIFGYLLSAAMIGLVLWTLHLVSDPSRWAWTTFALIFLAWVFWFIALMTWLARRWTPARGATITDHRWREREVV
jgi:hypothetical protein